MAEQGELEIVSHTYYLGINKGIRIVKTNIIIVNFIATGSGSGSMQIQERQTNLQIHADLDLMPVHNRGRG